MGLVTERDGHVVVSSVGGVGSVAMYLFALVAVAAGLGMAYWLWQDPPRDVVEGCCPVVLVVVFVVFGVALFGEPRYTVEADAEGMRLLTYRYGIRRRNERLTAADVRHLSSTRYTYKTSKGQTVVHHSLRIEKTNGTSEELPLGLSDGEAKAALRALSRVLNTRMTLPERSRIP